MRTFSTSLLALATMLSVLTASAQPAPPKPTAAAAAAQPPKPTASAATPPPARPAPPQKAVLPRILSEAMVKVARDLYVQGGEAMAQGRTADARAAFSAALGLNPHYSIYCNLGDADLRLGRPTNAAEEIAECIPGIEKDEKASEAERAAVRKLFANAKAKVVELVTHSGRAAGMPQVTTSIDTDRSSNNDDVTAYLEPGKHVVRFEAEGYESIAVDFDGAAGTRKEITPKWAKKPVATVPTASATATAEVPTAGPRKEIVIGGAVLAGAGLLAGIATGIAAGVASNDATKQRDALLAEPGACLNEPLKAACSTLEAKRREQSTLSNVAVVSFFGAAALGIATGAYVLVTRPKAAATSVHIAPVVGTTGAGVLVIGRF